MPSDLLAQVDEILQDLRGRVEAQLGDWQMATSPTKFRQMEIEVHELARQSADEISGLVLVAMSNDPEFQARTAAAAHQGSAGRLRSAGQRTVKVRLLGGSELALQVAYLAPRQRKAKRPSRRRRQRRRHKGLFPLLAALGICFGVTPALAGEICRQVADSDSVRTGRQALDRRGIDLGHKQTLRIVNAFGQRAVVQRNAWLHQALQRSPRAGVLSGQRVVVAVDGGRIRERVVKKGRRNEKTGHHRFDAPWCEPKLLIIYIVDNRGQVEHSFRPVLDATLGDCNVVFTMLAAYLRALGAHQAKELIVLGDGAVWIWDRVDELVKLVGLPKDRVSQLVDWYHAVETLHEVADKRKAWPKGERKRWLGRAEKALYAGDIDHLMRLFDGIAVGRRAKSVNKHRAYFRRNTGRMQYAAASAANRPLGSGAVESGIRRVINMRLKANGTFWLRDNAEAMLLLRSYLKAGRFDDLVDWSITTASLWGKLDQISKLSPVTESVAGRG